MANPGPFPIAFTLSASSISSTVYAEDVQVKYITKVFNRDEYLNSKLQQAQDYTTNARPIIVTNAVNAPVQIGIESCGFSATVPLGPEDDNLSNVLQRQNIIEYTIKGADSSPSAVLSLEPIANDHRARLDQFEAYLATLGQNISYQLLIQLRSGNFPYLTSTGLDASGIDISQSNCLISDFQAGTTYFNPSTQTAVARGWSLTIQVISFSTRLNQY